MYKRYIDDIWLMIESSHVTPDFISWLNNLHSTIKFTVNFLDVTIYRMALDTLAVCSYSKLTDKNNYRYLCYVIRDI